jgi:hypothetical protein
MKASKENADKALTAFSEIVKAIPAELFFPNRAKFLLVEDFLTAARKKAPHESSFHSDRIRKMS